ncbi:MAG: thiolase family protein [Thermoplasmata archaeon]
MKDVVIVNGVRTPQGKFGGSLKNVSASDLGKTVIKGLFDKIKARPKVSEIQKKIRPNKFRSIDKTEVEEKYWEWDEDLQKINIDEVIMGNVLQGGQGQNPARQASIKAGIPFEIPAYTVNKVCGSGSKAITLAADAILSGNAEAIIAGGMESMSSAPYVLPKARWGYKMDLDGQGEINDVMVLDGLYEIFYDYHMGYTAENLAELYDISREEQDRLGMESQNRAMKAVKNGTFEDEIVPVETSKGIFKKDETPRDTNMDLMSKLPPVFKEGGTVTAGNSSGISDGAAAVLVTSREFAEENDLNIMATLKGYASAGVDPKYMGLGPVPATRKVLNESGYSKKDLNLIEENEAFASQILACMEEMRTPKYGIDMNEVGSENVNPHGSGISLGHPIGCTGARIVVTLLHELERRDDNTGLASLCVGGGMGMSLLFDR